MPAFVEVCARKVSIRWNAIPVAEVRARLFEGGEIARPGVTGNRYVIDIVKNQ